MIPADKQAVFTRVWNELKEPAFDGRSCKYLTPDGRKCAIGLFLPDGHPAQDYQAGVFGLLSKFPNVAEPGVDRQFLADIQNAHDSPAESPDWRARFEADMLGIARDYGLEVPND